MKGFPQTQTPKMKRIGGAQMFDMKRIGVVLCNVVMVLCCMVKYIKKFHKCENIICYVWFGEKTSQEKKMPSNCHLMYLNLCKCLHDMHDDDGNEMYELSPLLDVKDIPWFINKAGKLTDWVHKTDCICKYDQLMSYVEQFDLNIAYRKKIIYCLAQDVLFHHRYETLHGHHSKCGICMQW